MGYNPLIHHRRSIRLQGYDYAQEGLYFITICTYQRAHIFGEIRNGEMNLSAFGEIAAESWLNLPSRFPHISLGEFIIMPNHMHGILQVVRAPLAGAPPGDATTLAGASPGSADSPPSAETTPAGNSQKEPPQNLPTIGMIIGAYKSLVATACLQHAKAVRPDESLGKLWHRNFYEHIIRNERAYRHISDYIRTNPAKWPQDVFSQKE